MYLQSFWDERNATHTFNPHSISTYQFQFPFIEKSIQYIRLSYKSNSIWPISVQGSLLWHPQISKALWSGKQDNLGYVYYSSLIRRITWNFHAVWCHFHPTICRNGYETPDVSAPHLQICCTRASGKSPVACNTTILCYLSWKMKDEVTIKLSERLTYRQ